MRGRLRTTGTQRLDWTGSESSFVTAVLSGLLICPRSCVSMRTRAAAILLLSVFSCAGAKAFAETIPPAVKAAEASIDGEKIRAHVKFLSDDLMEGRGPGLRGSELAAKYIATEFALYGLKPGGDDGSYLQEINFVGMNAIPAKTTFAFVPQKGNAIDLTY